MFVHGRLMIKKHIPFLINFERFLCSSTSIVKAVVEKQKVSVGQSPLQLLCNSAGTIEKECRILSPYGYSQGSVALDEAAAAGMFSNHEMAGKANLARIKSFIVVWVLDDAISMNA